MYYVLSDWLNCWSHEYLLCLALKNTERGKTHTHNTTWTKSHTKGRKHIGEIWLRHDYFLVFCWMPFVFWGAVQTELWLSDSANMIATHVRLTPWNTEKDRIQGITDSFGICPSHTGLSHQRFVLCFAFSFGVVLFFFFLFFLVVS